MIKPSGAQHTSMHDFTSLLFGLKEFQVVDVEQDTDLERVRVVTLLMGGSGRVWFDVSSVWQVSLRMLPARGMVDRRVADR